MTMAFGNGEVSGICLQGDGVLVTSYVAGGVDKTWGSPSMLSPVLR